MTTTPTPDTNPQPQTKRPWYRKKRHIAWMTIVGLFVLIGITSDPEEPTGTFEEAAADDEPAAEPTEDETLGPVFDNAGMRDEDQAPEREAERVADEPDPEPAPESKPEPEPEPEPDETVAQEQAVQAAESYLSMGGFSRKGLMQQLTSDYGEGFNKADAEYAIEKLNPDWRAQAVQAAESYLEMGGFSRDRLIEQLSSDYGEGFTAKQATYAVDEVGL